jgi:hypothetical protein
MTARLDRSRPAAGPAIPFLSLSSLWRPGWTACRGAFGSRRAGSAGMRAEGVEPPWAGARRLLRPVRLPCSATPAREPRQCAAPGSSGRPCGLPLVSCGVEARLATDLEHHDLCRAQRPLRARGDPDEVQMHLASPLSVEGRLAAPLSESAAGEVGDQLRRRRVGTGEVEHPQVVLVRHGHLLSSGGLSGRQVCWDSNPDFRGWSPACFRYTTVLHTPGWTRTSDLCLRRAALSPLSYGREKPPAGIEPAPRPYKGRVLAVDTTEARMRTDGVEPPQHWAPGLQPGELTVAQRPREG